jgi:hypothetical protein
MNETLVGTAELIELRKRIKSMSLPEQLRLAAELVERGKWSLGESIASSAVDELRLLRMMKR